eukprot:gene9918-20626_t
MIASMRSLARNSVSIRKLSTLAVETPRMTIAKNMLMFQHIVAAKDEKALADAAKSASSLDLANIPAELNYLKGYLTSATAASASGFEKDPKAWQNLPFKEFVVVEAQRAETWPFLVGAIATWVLLGCGIPMMLPEEGKKTSKYMQLLEKKKSSSNAEHAHH